MISYFQAAVLGLLQGFAELFPISSLGHTVLIPALLGWQVERSSDAFVAFLVLTHLATALVLLGFFWRDWLRIVAGVLRSLGQREIRPDDTHARLGWLLVVGTIPAGLVGLLFEERLKQLFAAATLVAAVLALNGAMLYAVERLRARGTAEGAHDDRKLAALSWAQAVIIGVAQCFALVPGFSRTGLTMGADLPVDSLTRTQSASRSSWQRRSFWPRPSSRSPTCSRMAAPDWVKPLSAPLAPA